MKPPASTHWQWPTVDAGVRDDRWARFLGDLKTFASLPQPLQTEGTLVRVTGLVLEATGLRLPVGSVCDVIGTDAQPVQAEVVGFHGDRCFLMPTGEIIGLASGARVVPRPVPSSRRASAMRTGHGVAVRTAGFTCRWARDCSAVSSTPTVGRSTHRGRWPTCAKSPW